eukprot:CAMPEP_0184340462 /NCGR_PEP_ID=MMETSP1089-20130417/9146_1 /TAXON_ID=38269 ORGANISM="Gloeochaete wittrockiana, Strain SAG46.84" /NCGR_SAMPLE_ID=MMETSP1089 /ASSEMBLY_ACC=CAM_ASM_000445 /LENGTH=394 /DNA_ID=CAMNT_0026668289 /DNA_START=437 /DNA_END=1618 /DNA_ORIENTATION=+
MERPKQGGLDIAGSTLNAEAREQADVFAGAEQEQEAGNHSDVFLKENMARPKQGGMETTCSPMASEIKDTPSVQVAERTGAHAGAEQKQDSPHRCLFVSIWEQESADAEPFLTINDAVAAANDGDAVRVDCLDCKEPHGLVIDKAIVLVGIDNKYHQKIVVSNHYSTEGCPCVILAGSGGEMRNVTVVAAHGSCGIHIQNWLWKLVDVEVIRGGEGGVSVPTSIPFSAVRSKFEGGLVAEGDATMENCRLEGLAIGVECAGDVTLKSCELKVAEGAALCTKGFRVTESVIDGVDGIEASGHGEISESKVKTTGVGFTVRSLVASETEIEGSVLVEEGDVRMTDTIVKAKDSGGVVVVVEGDVTMENCCVEGMAKGVECAGDVTLKSCELKVLVW